MTLVYMIEDDKKELIEAILKENRRGLSIEEISSRMKLNRQATKVLLAELKGEGKIFLRPIGQVKLHYWNFKGDD